MTVPRRYHDIGGRIDSAGWGDAGAIDRGERTLFHWERQCAAMRVMLGAQGLVPLDELRDTFESFGEALYNDLSFFERMLTSMTLILQHKQVLDAASIDAAVSALRARWQTDPGWLSQVLDRSADPCAEAPLQRRDPYGGRGYLPVADAPPTDAEWRTLALAEVLVDKGLLTRDGIRQAVQRVDAPQPAWGARIVARAWVDADFRRAIVADGRVACEAFGIPFLDGRLARSGSIEDAPAAVREPAAVGIEVREGGHDRSAAGTEHAIARRHQGDVADLVANPLVAERLQRVQRLEVRGIRHPVVQEDARITRRHDAPRRPPAHPPGRWRRQHTACERCIRRGADARRCSRTAHDQPPPRAASR